VRDRAALLDPLLCRGGQRNDGDRCCDKMTEIHSPTPICEFDSGSNASESKLLSGGLAVAMAAD
jgi:hypothetical protein